MDFNKLTIKSQEAVAAAQELARRRGNPEIYPEHLLLALEELMDAMQAQLEQMELRAEQLHEEMRARIEQVHRSYRRDLVLYRSPKPPAQRS